MAPDLINLFRLTSLTGGRSEIAVALIDGPVNLDLPCFASSRISDITRTASGTNRCAQSKSAACEHGTLVAGILTGSRESSPAICPECTFLVCPIFSERETDANGGPVSNPADLAAAITEAVNLGARIVNLSCGILQCSLSGEKELDRAFTYASKKQVLIFAASGNQGAVGGSCITKHASVVPVISLDRAGRPAKESNLSASIGRRGLAAPGQNVMSVGATGLPALFSGTSAACAFATGAAALLWSEFPRLPVWEIKAALVSVTRSRSIVPPAMNAWGAYQSLESRFGNRKFA